jgi:hypothetical protein
MLYKDFIRPTEVEIGGRKFAISKIPALDAQDEIYPAVSKAVLDNGPVGLSMLPKRVVNMILSRTALRNDDGSWYELDMESRINNTFTNIGEMHMLVAAMIKENFCFFFDGSLLKSLEDAAGITATESDS